MAEVIIEMSQGVYLVRSGQTINFKVASDFDYHVCLEANSIARFESLSGPITLHGHIWGPGQLEVACKLAFKEDQETAFQRPPKEQLMNKPLFTFVTSCDEVIP